MTEITVSATDLVLRFGATVALDRVSFRLGRGTTGLLGPNGAGKTTLLRILATAAGRQSGDLTILGEDPALAEGRLAVRRNLGYLPQSPGLYPQFTAFQFIEYVAILKELSDRRARREEVRRVLDVVGLAERASSRIKTMSGGMRQRVALAAALLNDPALLILDEPTVGLDPEQRMRFRELLSSLGEGRTVLVSTHQTEDVVMICQQVIVLDQGRIRFDGTPDGLVDVARGRVWRSEAKSEGALAGWRTGGGFYRNIGDPPPGADLLAPTIEDGYLTLIDASRVAMEAV